MGLSRQANDRDRQHHPERMSRAQTLVQMLREQRMLQPGLGTRKLYHVLRQPLK